MTKTLDYNPGGPTAPNGEYKSYTIFLFPGDWNYLTKISFSLISSENKATIVLVDNVVHEGCVGRWYAVVDVCAREGEG